MLLLTSLAFGGSEAIGAYEHLPPEEEELLKHRAQALAQIPREKRVPLLVQEIKRLFTARRRQLASADPKRLAKVIRDERPAMKAVILGSLPAEVADAIRAELGEADAPGQPTKEVRPEILSVIRWKLEDALRAGAPQVGGFRFSDMILLQQRDIFAVADRMGARVLATAIAGLAEGERAEFLEKLPPDQRALAVRAGEAGASRRLSEKDAHTVLEIYGALESPSAGMRSAGIQRVARACIAQSPEFAQRMIERHHGELGRLMQRWVREERPKPIKGDGGRLDIVEQLERLAQKGIIDRPMRLPPPRLMPAPPPPPQPEPAYPARAERSQAKVLVQPPARRHTNSLAQPAPEPERSRRSEPGREASKVGMHPALTDSQIKQRVLRDGKPLVREKSNDPEGLVDTRPPERRGASPVQGLPKRRPTTSLPEGPPPEGSGRGTRGGSR